SEGMSGRRRLIAGAIAATTVLTLTVVASGTSPAATPGPGAAINQVMSKPLYAHSRWGLLTQNLANKHYLTSLNASQFFIPGSNAKLFSTSSLWSTLGPDYRFKTPV